jgi:TonB family protein
MSWWHYLLLVNFYLILFFIFYALLLRKETFFQLNRIFLVSASLLSFLIPLIHANWVKDLFITKQVQQTIYSTYSSPIVINGYTFKPVEKLLTLGEILSYLYLIIAFLLVVKLVWQLVILKKEIEKPDPSVAYSFFKKISVGNKMENADIIAEHEQVHASQWHSLDVLVIEIIAIINWFNPVVYLYRFAIKYVHEFIADREVLQAGTDKADYALLLLSQTFDIPNHNLASNFYNHSLLKQRIKMLQKSKSKRIALIKYGLSAPLFVLMLILSSATVSNSTVLKTISKSAEEVFLTPASSSVAMLTDLPLAVPLAPVQINEDAYKKAISEQEVIPADEPKFMPDTGKIYTVVEVLPSFPGGNSNFIQFLASNIRYPAEDRKNNTQGRVTMQFVVEADGKLSNIRSLRSPTPAMAEEGVRVLASSPAWRPGIQNGRAVRAMFTVPINFTLAYDPVQNNINNEASKITIRDQEGKPLIIKDGIEIESLNNVNPNTIESVTILKDATATEKYGLKGVNGVIIITTKKDSGSQPAIKNPATTAAPSKTN